MAFHDLHDRVLPLLLPNAWDVPTALAFIDCGFTAIGTTRLGVASSQSSADGVRSTNDRAAIHAAAASRAMQAGSRPSRPAPSWSA